MNNKVTIQLIIFVMFVGTAELFAQSSQGNASLLLEQYGANYEEVMDKYGDNPELLEKAAQEYAKSSSLQKKAEMRSYFKSMNKAADISSKYVARAESEPNDFFNTSDNIDDVITATGVLSTEYTGKLIAGEFNTPTDVDVYEFTVDTTMMYYFAGLHSVNEEGSEINVNARLFHESDLDTTIIEDFKGIAGNEQISGDILGRNTDGRGGAGLFRLTGWSAPIDQATGKQVSGKYYLWIFNDQGKTGSYYMTAYAIPFANFKDKAESNYGFENLVVNSYTDPSMVLNTDGVVRSFMLYSDTVKKVAPEIPSQANAVYDFLEEGDEDVDLFFIDYKKDHTLVVETMPYFGFYRDPDGSISSGSSRLSDPKIRIYNGDFSTKLAEDDDGARENMDGPNNIHSRIVIYSNQLGEAGLNEDGSLVLWVSAWASQELERTAASGDVNRTVDNRDPGRMMYKLYSYQYANDPVEFEPNNQTDEATVIAARGDTVINGSLASGDVDMFRVFLHQARMYTLFSKTSNFGSDVNVELFYESEVSGKDGTIGLSGDLISANSIPVKRSGKDFLISGFIPESSGAYIVKITSSATGNYQLGVVDKGETYWGLIANEPNNTIAESYEQGLLETGAGAAAVTGLIFPVGDVDHYRIKSGEDFTITLKGTHSSLVKDFSGKLTLYDSGMAELASSTNGSLSYSPSAAGEFIIKVEATTASEVGFYSISGGEPFEEQEPNNVFENATPIILGELYEAALGSGDVDYFSFDLKAGSLYSFRSVDNNTGGAFDVEFYDEINGTTIMDESDWYNNYSTDNFKIANIMPTEDKTYYLKISGGVGSYKLLSRVNDQFGELKTKHEPDNSIAEADMQGTYLMDGTDHMYVQYAADSARFFGDIDYFKLELTAGMKFVAETKPVAGTTAASSNPDLWNKDTDTRIRLFDATGTEVASDDDSGNEWYSKVETTVPATGVYYLQVANSRDPGKGDDRSMQRGDYILNVAASYDETENNNDFASADNNPLVAGGFVSGVFTDEADIDIYKITMEAGKIYHMRSLKEDDDDSAIGVELYATGATTTNLLADGSSFNTRYSGSNFKINFIPDATGAFYLKLTPPAGSVEKPYNVYAKSNEIAPIKDVNEPNNTMGEVTSSEPGDGEFRDYMLYNATVEGFHDDLDYYMITAAAGDTLIGETAPFNGEFWPRDFDAYMYLYDAEGTELAQDDDGGYDWHSKIEYVVPTDGNYYFLVIGEDAHVEPRSQTSNRVRDPARGEYKFAITKKVSVGTANEEELTNVYEFRLDQNYPNPFNPATTIRYQIGKQANVSLEVFNILGQKVATLVNAKQIPGMYHVSFDAHSLATGMYIYRLQAGDKVQINKMLLIK